MEGRGPGTEVPTFRKDARFRRIEQIYYQAVERGEKERPGFLAQACDGPNPMQLTSFGGAAAGGPTWSPDGQKIAFHAYPGGEGFVYVISANGGVPSRLRADPPGGRWPNWSRDGRSIYFGTDSGGSSQIYVAAVTGGKAVQVTQDPDYPDRSHESADGRFVYYMKGYLVPPECLEGAGRGRRRKQGARRLAVRSVFQHRSRRGLLFQRARRSAFG